MIFNQLSDVSTPLFTQTRHIDQNPNAMGIPKEYLIGCFQLKRMKAYIPNGKSGSFISFQLQAYRPIMCLATLS